MESVNSLIKSSFSIISLILLLSSCAFGANKNSCNDELLVRAKAQIDSYAGNLNQLKAASGELKKLLIESPDCAPAYRELARIKMKAGHLHDDVFRPGMLDEAEMLLKKSISIDNSYSDAYVLLSSVYINKNNYKKAEEMALRASELGSTSPWLSMRMATIAIHKKEYNKAEKYYLELINSERQNEYEVKRTIGVAIEALARLYISTNKLDRADELYRNLIEKEGTAWQHGDYAQFLLYYMGDYDKAISESRAALEIMDYGVGRYMLAASLYRKWAQIVMVDNKLEEAQVYFNQAYEVYPNIREIYSDALSSSTTKMTAEALKKYYKIAMENYSNEKNNN